MQEWRTQLFTVHSKLLISIFSVSSSCTVSWWLFLYPWKSFFSTFQRMWKFPRAPLFSWWWGEWFCFFNVYSRWCNKSTEKHIGRVTNIKWNPEWPPPRLHRGKCQPQSPSCPQPQPCRTLKDNCCSDSCHNFLTFSPFGAGGRARGRALGLLDSLHHWPASFVSSLTAFEHSEARIKQYSLALPGLDVNGS